MTLSASEFRKNLFAVLQKVVQGETVEILYKGSSVRVASSRSSAKLARAKPQDTLLCDPDAIVHSDKRLMAELEAKWRKDWSKM